MAFFFAKTNMYMFIKNIKIKGSRSMAKVVMVYTSNKAQWLSHDRLHGGR